MFPPWFATGQQHFRKNDNTKDNTPIIRISHTDRAVEGQLVTLDASRSLDPDGEPIKFSWKKISPDDLDVHISNGNSPIASFIAPPVKIDVSVSIEHLTIDENGNKDTALIHITISKKQIEVKKDQIDKPKIKSQELTSIKREPNPQTRSEPEQPQLSNQLSKSPNIVDKKIKVNAGKDIEVANGTLVKLRGSISSNSDSKQIKLSWTQKKGPHVDLSSNVVLNPTFRAPDVQQDERIQFEFGDSDQNGHTVSDSIDVFVHA